MRKKLLIMTSLAFGIGLNAQTYFSDDFSSGNLNNWTLTDSDGDGNNWMLSDNEYAYSASYSNQVGILTPDNWMISQAIVIPAEATSPKLTWQTGATDPNWAEENYSVYVGTSSDLASLEASTVTFTEVIGSPDLLDRLLDVSAFVGQTVYIAFRHHNVSDQFQMLIDNVMLSELASTDMALTSVNIDPFYLAGDISIKGTVKSVGAENITSIDITYDAGDGPVTESNIPVNLNYGDSYDFTHSIPLSAVANQAYNVQVSVSASGDINSVNDSLQGSFSTVSELVTKRTVGEEKTGEWCGWCPRGSVAMAEMAVSNPDDFIGIAIHAGDIMEVNAYASDIEAYVPGGYPGAGLDRVFAGDPSDFALMHAARSTRIAPADLSVTLTADGTTVTSEVSANFVASVSGDYRLAVVLIQDGVEGNGQANYYNNGNSGALSMPNTGSMPNLNFVGAGDPVSPFLHDHVAVAMGDNEINGAEGSLPGSINGGDVHSHTYTFPQNSNWDMSKMHAVGMLVNAATGEILNAAKSEDMPAGIGTLDSDNFTIRAFPNPSKGLSKLTLQLDEAAEVNVTVVNMLGEVVYAQDAGTLVPGAYETILNLSTEGSAMYFARVRVNDSVKTIKLNVIK